MADKMASSMKLVEIYEKASVAEFTSLLEQGLDVTFSQIETQSKLAGLRAVAFVAWETGMESARKAGEALDTAFEPKNPYRDRL